MWGVSRSPLWSVSATPVGGWAFKVLLLATYISLISSVLKAAQLLWLTDHGLVKVEAILARMSGESDEEHQAELWH